jgi:chromate transporter
MRDHSPLEVFLVFLKLGLTSFGGPIAHLGYFRQELVERRRWVGDATYTDLVALCQFLPGPASSQVGFSLGLIRAGYGGGVAAWAGFTLPSAILMTAFAYGAAALTGPIGNSLLHGLKLAAVAIVAQAICGMVRTLCPDRERASIAGVAAIVLLFTTSAIAQFGVILMGGLAGFWLCRTAATASTAVFAIPVSRRVGILALCIYVVLLVVLPVFGAVSPMAQLFDAGYRSGALVFGGGHVVLPLLRNAFVGPGWVSDGSFLAGYGAAQAVPGPLFSFAAYLGAVATPAPNRLAGALLGVIAIFLPGLLVLLGALPFWDTLRQRTRAQAAMRGINAAVVGLLGAALYNPLWIGSITSAGDVAVALGAFILLMAWRAPPLLVVIVAALGGLVV